MESETWPASTHGIGKLPERNINFEGIMEDLPYRPWLPSEANVLGRNTHATL